MALIFLCTNNSTVKAALFKGGSTSSKLFELVLTVRCLEMQVGAKIIVRHVLGEQMKAQGTNSVSRGQLKEGVPVLGKDMSRDRSRHANGVTPARYSQREYVPNGIQGHAPYRVL
jgi:hypothetical protein